METAPALLNARTALAACRGDAALARALTEQYRTSLPAEQAALAQAYAITPPDWATIRARVHRLQSGSAYLGIERIAVAARRVEEGIRTQDSRAARAAAWQALEQAFKEFLNVSPAEWDARLTVVTRPSADAFRRT